MIVDFDLGFALRGSDPPGVKDLDLGFSLRLAPQSTQLDLDLDFELQFDTNQSIAVLRVAERLAYAPLLTLVGGVLVDPVNGEEWSP